MPLGILVVASETVDFEVKLPPAWGLASTLGTSSFLTRLVPSAPVAVSRQVAPVGARRHAVRVLLVARQEVELLLVVSVHVVVALVMGCVMVLVGLSGRSGLWPCVVVPVLVAA